MSSSRCRLSYSTSMCQSLRVWSGDRHRRGADWKVRSRFWISQSQQSMSNSRLCVRLCSRSTLWSRQWHSLCHRSRTKSWLCVRLCFKSACTMSRRWPRAMDAADNHGGVSGSPRAEPSLPRRAVVGSGKRVNLVGTLRMSCSRRRWHGRE